MSARCECVRSSSSFFIYNVLPPLKQRPHIKVWLENFQVDAMRICKRHTYTLECMCIDRHYSVLNETVFNVCPCARVFCLVCSSALWLYQLISTYCTSIWTLELRITEYIACNVCDSECNRPIDVEWLMRFLRFSHFILSPLRETKCHSGLYMRFPPSPRSSHDARRPQRNDGTQEADNKILKYY